jgi:hypothetical protein
MAGSSEIGHVQSRENKRKWSAGQDGVRGGIGICEMKIHATEGQNSEYIFRQKLRPESSDL